MKKYFKDIRNILHSFIGLVLGYDITMLFGFTNRDNFPLSWGDLRTLLAPFVGAIIVWIISFYWEKEQDKIKKNVSDMRDVYNGFAFAYIGGLIALFIPSLLVAVVLSLLAFVLFLRSFKK
jgi:uncharacterized membrane protein